MSTYTLNSEQISSNYQAVLDRIRSAAQAAGRNPNDVKLVTVSKEKPISIIESAIRAGMHIFGENYAEDALPKIEALRKQDGIQWHMIGHVQSRKARIVIENFDFMHSLDSVKLARRLNRYAQDVGKIFPALIEYNLSGEPSKYGFPAWKEGNWGDLSPSIEQILELPNLQIQGIMTVPPYSEDPEESRQYYKLLSSLQRFLQVHFSQVSWSELSMGMSSDYEVAIEEGATWVRIGEALLGPRN